MRYISDELMELTCGKERLFLTTSTYYKKVLALWKQEGAAETEQAEHCVYLPDGVLYGGSGRLRCCHQGTHLPGEYSRK